MAVYKDKKRKTWFFRVYVNDCGRKKQKERSGFKSKAEAVKKEQAFIFAWENNLIKKDFDNYTRNNSYKSMKFIDLYNEYKIYKSQELKPQSIRSMTSRFNNHIIPYFKKYRISEIDNKVYMQWKELIISKNFSYKYNSSLHNCMVSILNYAMKFYDLDKNIASKIGNFSNRNYVPKINFWELSEFNQFISVVNDRVYYTLFHTLFFTGIRIGECLALTWKDYNGVYLDINKTLAKGKNNGNYIITRPKTRTSIRRVNLDKETIHLLEELKAYYQERYSFSYDWFIFGGRKALSHTTVCRRKNKYCSIAGVKQIRIHDFRHSHATFLISNKVPPPVVSERLGHKDIAMTLNVYSHLIQEDSDKAVNLINNLDRKGL